jgi:hypothetical protein
MAKLRQKVLDFSEITSTIENRENEIDKQIQTNENELINVNRDLVKVETKIISIKKRRINETSVS